MSVYDLFREIAVEYDDWKKAEMAIQNQYRQHRQRFGPEFTADDLVKWSYETGILTACSGGGRRMAITLNHISGISGA